MASPSDKSSPPDLFNPETAWIVQGGDGFWYIHGGETGGLAPTNGFRVSTLGYARFITQSGAMDYMAYRKRLLAQPPSAAALSEDALTIMAWEMCIPLESIAFNRKEDDAPDLAGPMRLGLPQAVKLLKLALAKAPVSPQATTRVTLGGEPWFDTSPSHVAAPSDSALAREFNEGRNKLLSSTVELNVIDARLEWVRQAAAKALPMPSRDELAAFHDGFMAALSAMGEKKP